MNKIFTHQICLLLPLVTLFASCKTRPADLSQTPIVRKDKAFTEFFRRTSGWVAGDGAISLPLQDGRVLWFFGDSHVNDFDARSRTVPCLFQVRNAAIIHDKNNLRPSGTRLVNEPANKNLFHHPDGGKFWFWPMAGFQSGDAVYVSLMALQPRGIPGMWDFKGIGQYWAKMKLPDLESISYVALPDFNGIDFGCGFFPEPESGYTFAFGQKGNGRGTLIYVARFRTAEPEGDWTFWNGKNWNANVANAVAVASGASVSVSACKIKNKFLLTSSALSTQCDTGKEIFVSTSDSPTGPFTPLKKIFTLDDTFHGHYPFFYIPVAHPEFMNAKNELLITYSINGYDPCVPTCVNGRMNPDHYRPKAIRVPLKVIDPEF